MPARAFVRPFEPIMDRELFRRFSEIAYAQTGITLREGKEALVSARIAKRLRALGLESSRAYLEYLESGESTDEVLQFVDAICTNYTRFFREEAHFEFLAETFRGWMREGQTRFRLWSAACSSGEEPYSMAMTLLDDCQAEGLDAKILATDLSRRVLARAVEGRYPRGALCSVREALRARWFRPVPGEQGVWEANEPLKSCVVFKRLNLASPPFPMTGPLDIVFCRNVMIYFDAGARRTLVSECERLLRPGGYLVTGHSETLTGLGGHLRMVKPSVYRKLGGT